MMPGGGPSLRSAAAPTEAAHAGAPGPLAAGTGVLLLEASPTPDVALAVRSAGPLPVVVCVRPAQQRLGRSAHGVLHGAGPDTAHCRAQPQGMGQDPRRMAGLL